jgi:hypothetical protein
MTPDLFIIENESRIITIFIFVRQINKFLS